jgi:capsular exopolysaccharide synthesis family protein
MRDQFEEGKEKSIEGLRIDFKRIGYNSLRYWYLIILSLAIALGFAYLKNRYAVRIYPVTASIIIREKEETTGGELLYKNALIDAYRNYLNEPYILRSYPMVGKVIDELNFEVAFYKKGSFKTTETYNLPVKAKLLKKNGSYGASLILRVLDEQKYLLREIKDQNATGGKVFYFNDSIEYMGHSLVLLRDKNRSLDDIKNSDYQLTFLDPLQVTGAYVGSLGVQWAEEGAGVINLSLQGSNPSKDIDFLNGLIAAYQKYDLDKKNQTAERTIQFIKGQLANIADSLHLFERQLEQFKLQNSATGLEDEAKRLFDKLEPLEAQKTELIIRRNYYDYLEGYIKRGGNLDLVILPSSVGASDPILNTMVEKMIDVQLELKLFIGTQKSENPLVQSGTKRLAEIKNEIVSSIRSLKDTDKFKSDYLNTQIKAVEDQINKLPLLQRQFISIQRNYSLLENLYVFLMQKMSEAGISKASNVSDIVVVNPPMRGGLIAPNTGRNYLFGWVLGLLIPVIVFVLMELLNDKIQSKEDVDKITQIPFIGGVGHNSAKINLAVIDRPKSAVAESFRAIRSNLNFFTGNNVKKVFMVSSSISGEGKTFTTINLATVFAMSGRRTLIIGADMRRPKIYQDFNLGNSLGLSGYLSGLNSLDEVIQPTSVENLDLISGGPVPPNPSELLLTDRLGKLFEDALKRYDYVLIDTPPLAIVTDAFVLSKYSDYTVFVIRQNFTPKNFIRNIDDYYTAGKFKNISIVLNDIYKSGLGYGYGYSYGYGYGYGYGVGRKKKHTGGYYEES